MLEYLSRSLSEKCIQLSEQSQQLVEAARELRSTAEGQVADAKELIARLRSRESLVR